MPKWRYTGTQQMEDTTHRRTWSPDDVKSVAEGTEGPSPGEWVSEEAKQEEGPDTETAPAEETTE